MAKHKFIFRGDRVSERAPAGQTQGAEILEGVFSLHWFNTMKHNANQAQNQLVVECRN